jgi:streptomycin 6-kinase
MLLERCIPGTSLRSVAEAEQDVVIASLLRRLWRTPGPNQPFRSLNLMIEHWCQESVAKSELWPDKALAAEGIRVFEDLLSDQRDQALLATDLHAGNVLSAQRMRWIVIDPKPFLGDPCYDATQHLLNCKDRLRANPSQIIKRFANLLEVDEQRVRQWTFARLAVECAVDIDMTASHALARCLSNW